MRFLVLILPASLAACAASWQPEYDRLRDDLDAVIVRHSTVPPGPSTDETLDKSLAGAVGPEEILAVALTRNADLRELAARASAMLHETDRAGALDDPMLRFKADQIPLRTPSALNRDDMNVLTLEQRLPFPGTLGLKSEAALRQAQAMHQMFVDRELEITAMVRKAWAEYASMSKHLEIHKDHVTILEEFEKISDAKFRTGAVSQQDVLKPQVELVMLQNEIITDRQRIETARAELNRLMNRPADAPIGNPRELPPVAKEEARVDALMASALDHRPDLKAAEFRVKSAGAALSAAEREATWPEFAVGVEYMQLNDADDAWAGMLGINLPWLTGKHRAEVRKMRDEQRAEQLALESARARVQFEVREAWLRVDATRKSVALFESELMPKSRQSVEVSRASYEKEKASFLDLLDAERSLRDVRIAYTRALADYAAAVADLERAAALRRKP